MDDIVKAALAKWPNVPACYGWLGLDARGDWYMRDDGTQAAGPFAVQAGQAGSASKGSRLLHGKLIDFIGRNYLADDGGQWFFQNGPQRVYVELEAVPYVWRLQTDGAILAHTGVPAGAVRQSLLDETGHLYLVTDLGLGLVHTSDMLQAADAVERGDWSPVDVKAGDLPGQWQFVRSPQRQHDGTQTTGQKA
ncbi:DUF2946 family protein [Hydrogenophaga sp. PAMC20947]|uniref:DUF2946 family protein n=1 Tax=Hydrogenophaga sp. PAMC20947 TaxID=2565558 RepID=UPI00109D8F87|nr:DUF2946 family protein [Hydrogenophaga sp. PAMC20947]QCB47257.1 DUF2946 family protein [Hydrogenophaga sp. PAMC20947]